jgi:hypothetical protein
MDVADEILSEFGKKTGLGELKFSESGVVSFVVDEELKISIERSQNKELIHLYTAFRSLPNENREKIYQKLLEAHMFGVDTGNAYFCLDRLSGELLFALNLSLSVLNQEYLEDVFGKFLNYASLWQKRINQGCFSVQDEMKIDNSENDREFPPSSLMV